MPKYKGKETHDITLDQIFNPTKIPSRKRYIQKLLYGDESTTCLGHYLPSKCEETICSGCILYQSDNIHLVRQEWIKELLEEEQ